MGHNKRLRHGEPELHQSGDSLAQKKWHHIQRRVPKHVVIADVILMRIDLHKMSRPAGPPYASPSEMVGLAVIGLVQ